VWFRKNGPNPIYENQAKTAGIVMKHLESVNVVTLVAQMQSGKTGAMHLIANMAVTMFKIPHENVFFITGMNNIDWTQQTKKRVIPEYQDHVLHNSDLRGDFAFPARDAIILIDECHYGTGEATTLDKLFKRCGLLATVDELRKRNIRIVCVSATPGPALYNAQEWGVGHRMVRMSPGDGYLSVAMLLDNGRIRAPFNLKTRDGVDAYLTTVKGTGRPLWHLLRMQDSNHRSALEAEAKRRGIHIEYHDSKSRFQIENKIVRAPKKPTIVILKSLLRAAKTLWEIARISMEPPYDCHIGTTHDTNSQVGDTSALMQGLLGRFCGHGLSMGADGPIHYVKRSAVDEYVKWWNDMCQYDNYTSRTLQTRAGVATKINDTIMLGDNIDGMPKKPHERIRDESDEDDMDVPEVGVRIYTEAIYLEPRPPGSTTPIGELDPDQFPKAKLDKLFMHLRKEGLVQAKEQGFRNIITKTLVKAHEGKLKKDNPSCAYVNGKMVGYVDEWKAKHQVFELAQLKSYHSWGRTLKRLTLCYDGDRPVLYVRIPVNDIVPISI
jgi:hypothetical protein